MTTVTHRLVAFNTAQESENKIHDNEVAQRFGFTGGLVPGVDVYAYLSWGPVQQWGRQFLESGTMTARFGRPTYDGDLVSVEWDGETLALRNPGGDVVSEGRAGLEAVAGPDLAEYPRAEKPPREARPPAAPQSLPVGTVLGTWSAHFHADKHRQYLDDVRETLPIYRELGVAHPGWVARTGNWILSENVVLGPWMHVGSTITNLALIPDGALVETRGTVAAEYEKKGHRFCELDLLVTANEVPAALIRHTAIYRPRQVAELG
ncbi:MAG: hypothetical protein ACKV2O_14480 [Acidimicrobiales bacterium]